MKKEQEIRKMYKQMDIEERYKGLFERLEKDLIYQGYAIMNFEEIHNSIFQPRDSFYEDIKNRLRELGYNCSEEPDGNEHYLLKIKLKTK